jgi:hypothetical protein
MPNPIYLMRSRRQFLLGSGAATLGLTLPGCDAPPAERYAQADIELLAQQRALEEKTRGRGPYGRHVYPGYRGLAQLPWFDLDANGALRCTDEEVPYSIDVHCPFGHVLFYLDPTSICSQQRPASNIYWTAMDRRRGAHSIWTLTLMATFLGKHSII